MQLSSSDVHHFASKEELHLNTHLENQCANSNIHEKTFKESVSTRRHMQYNRSSDNLYIAKLESKALELQKRLDTQSYQIDTLSAQTEHYMKICEEQKEQLARLDLQLLRQEYEDQIRELVEEKQKITELIYNLTEQYKELDLEYDHDLIISKAKNAELAQHIEDSLNEKEQLLAAISQADQQQLQYKQTIQQQEERIDQLRNIQRKLFIALKEMKALEAQK